jgi:hypothetical protein
MKKQKSLNERLVQDIENCLTTIEEQTKHEEIYKKIITCQKRRIASLEALLEQLQHQFPAIRTWLENQPPQP